MKVLNMKSAYTSLMDFFYRLSIWLAGISIVLMSIIIPWGIYARYVMGTGSQWPEPIAILLMIVFTFIGSAAAYRANAHIAVHMLTDAVSENLRKLLLTLADLLMLLVSVFVVIYGTRLCFETMGQAISELPWLPVGVTYAPLPIGAAITFLFVLEKIWVGSQHRRPLMRFEETNNLGQLPSEEH
jgi:TRAP-type C4-dicarboxylate transport system permease small subunit